MKFLESFAPLQIAGSAHRVRVAWDLPAAEVLAASGKSKRFRSVRGKPQDPAGQPFRINQFPRAGGSGNRLDIGISGILLVKAVQGRLEPVGVGRWEFRRHVLVLSQK